MRHTIIFKRIALGSLATSMALTLSACATPTVSTHVSITSRMAPSVTSTDGAARPDWGHTVVIVPDKGITRDATYEQIKKGIETMLFAAKMTPSDDKPKADYRLAVSWSLAQSRIVQEAEQVPVVVHHGAFHMGHRPRMHGPRGPGHRPGAGHRPPPPAPAPMMTSIAYVTQIKNVPLYLRSLTVKLYNRKEAAPIYTATATHESHCNTYTDAMPYLIHSALNNLYAADGTQKIDTVPQQTQICR